MTADQLAASRRLRERLAPALCEDSLHFFLRHFWSEMDPSRYIDGWHIRVICEHLEEVVRGGIRRLIINIPPRHSKSLICSVALPAWIWAQPKSDGSFSLAGPQTKFMSVSYAHHLSVDHARCCRVLIQSDRYQRYWGEHVRLSSDQNAKGRYDTTARGYRLATSVGGIATGFGADIILVDDPMNPQQAHSDRERQQVIDWWSQVIQTRLNDPKTGVIVVIMQRLHQSDLTGHILAHETGWTHLCLPARYEHDHPHVSDCDERTEDGALLWPGRYPADEVDALERSLGTYVSAGQLQQRPAPRDGGMFRRSWFEVVPAAPAGGRLVRGWDLAASTGPRAAYTAGVLMSRRGKGEYCVHDVVRERTTSLTHLVCDTARRDGSGVVVDVPQDPGAAGKQLVRHIAQALSGYTVRHSPETGAKEVRAEPYSSQAEVGNVSLVRGRWNEAYLAELESFPNGEYADQVDASSRAFHQLASRRRRGFSPGGQLFIGPKPDVWY